MKPGERAEAIAKELHELAAALTNIDSLQERTSRAKADFESIQQNLDQVKREMASATAGLTQVQVEAQRRHDQDVFNKQGELRGLQERIEALKAKDKELGEELANKSRQLGSINLSVADLKTRLGAA